MQEEKAQKLYQVQGGDYGMGLISSYREQDTCRNLNRQTVLNLELGCLPL
jgi:hypothetical protein